MAAVLGLRGTGSFSSDQLPENFRETMLYLFPNGSAPLTAILSKLKSEATGHPVFNVFTKALPSQITLVAGSAPDDNDTTVTVTTGDGTIFKGGHIVKNLRTLEIFWVSSISSDTLTIARGKGAAAAAMTTGDELLIIGSAYPEGDSVPDAISYDPDIVTNYCQIFRTVGNLTKTVSAETTFRTGKQMTEEKREKLELHSIEMEKGFMFGGGVSTTGTNGQPLRTTKGLANFISTNVSDYSSSGLSLKDWNNFLSDVFKKGSNEKLLLCGNTFLNVLTQMALNNFTIEATPTTDTYGMRMRNYTTPFGDLQIKTHPLLNESATLSASGFILDTKYLVYRYLNGRDTQFHPDVADKGDDADKFEYLTECGIEVQFEETHGYITGVSEFTP